MSILLSNTIISVYFLMAGMLALYGLNCYVMIYLFHRGRVNAEKKTRSVEKLIGNPFINRNLPFVTTQIPIYNEYNVAERVIRAACKIKYPKGYHEIQILDDSTDETSALIDEVVSRLKKEGNDITIIRRSERTGYKAGALANGLNYAKGELTAIFDADFVPTEDYLQRIVPFFMADDRTGLVQARWGHLNRRKSLITRAQSIGIDGHFAVEQAARNWNDLFMNFNGTAGVWRKQAIIDGGGWQWDTLTEDMDLSYRAQFVGWHAIFLPDLVVQAEIPEDVNAFKSQQFRWAKGSIQTAKKLLPHIFRSKIPLFKKIEAVFHLTHYFVHPMMFTLALLALPTLLFFKTSFGPHVFTIIGITLCITMFAPSALYITSQKVSYSDWVRRIIFLPFLVVVGVGIAVSNTRAVFEALIGTESEFIRTPKKGDSEIKTYKIKLPWSGVVEVLLGLYCCLSFGYYLVAGKYLVGPFLAIYASGFLFIGLLTLFHASGSTR